MKRFLFLTILSFCMESRALAATHPDSLEIRHYGIHLSIDQPAKSISGYTDIRVKSRVNNLQQIRLDLLRLAVDSVIWNTANLAFTHNDTLLSIPILPALNQDDSLELRVYYHGMPVADATWGGFYFSGVYAFNMGVGFDAEPNSFGRVWYPCMDDFLSRSTYDFYITVDSTTKAYCNGLLQSVSHPGNGKSTWHWMEKRPTPVYLVSVAVAPYASVSWTYKSQIDGRNIPVLLNALPADTARLRASFIHLDSAIAIFERQFGPYPFDRIGYNVVPFNGGAMEHTGNIAYPLFAIDGGLTYETMMAHEFAHSWFGGAVNCATSSDMWLNEGWASFSENIFIEGTYGKTAYKNEVRKTHFEVLHWSHLRENGYWPVSGVPHALTYGNHVYKKGSDVAHTIRAYFGSYDDLFIAIKQYMQNNLYSSVNSEDFKASLKAMSFYDLDACFSNWVYQQGFPHFSLKNWSVKSPSGGSYPVDVTISQGLSGTTTLYTGVPLEITFIGANRQTFKSNVIMDAAERTWTLAVPFSPVYVAIDMDEHISDAITDKFMNLRLNDSVDYGEALMRIKVNVCNDSALLRVEHNWVAADQDFCTIPGLYVSTSRYWTIDGIWPNGFKATAYITYDGRKPASMGGTGWLDHTFIRKTEDSLFLAYRPNSTSNWALWSDMVKTVGSTVDKYGTIRINNIRKGQYALAMYDKTLDVGSAESPEQFIEAWPNPVENILYIRLLMPSAGRLYLYDLNGRELCSRPVGADEQQLDIDMQGMSPGCYFLRFRQDDGRHFSTKVLLR